MEWNEAVSKKTEQGLNWKGEPELNGKALGLSSSPH
jgi:hypothetical protein